MLALALRKVVVGVAVVYSASLLATLSIKVGTTQELGLWEELRFAFAASALLDLVLAAIIGGAWRQIWKWVPVLNRWLYPDLNGAWKVSIDWERSGETGHTEATAHIRQTLTQLSMTLKSDKSESSTICCVPRKDPVSGRPLLDYLYNNEPKQGIAGDHERHIGAATLKVGVDNHDELTGNYFTDRATKGHYTMVRSAGT